MPTLDTDDRFKFQIPPVQLTDDIAVLSVDSFGGPIAVIKATLFDDNDKELAASVPLSTENGGSVAWMFNTSGINNSKKCYLKWYVWPVRSAAGLGGFDVTVKLANKRGDVFATAVFAGTLPDGKLTTDDPIVDGTYVTR